MCIECASLHIEICGHVLQPIGSKTTPHHTNTVKKCARMRMFATENILQHYRFARLVMLVIIVGLTIFLYTSYYANQTMERLPSSQHFQMPSVISASSLMDTSSSSSNSNPINGSNGNKLVIGSGRTVKQQFIGNNLNDNLSNSLVNNEISNIVQQSNLAGEW